MSNISAGIGRGQMEILEDRIKQRRENHDFYQENFKNIEGVDLFSAPNEDFFSNYWLNTIVTDENILSKENIKKIFLQNNIETRYLWNPMHLQPLYKKYKFFGNNFSGIIFANGLCLPSGTNLTDNCKNRIAEILSKF